VVLYRHDEDAEEHGEHDDSVEDRTFDDSGQQDSERSANLNPDLKDGGRVR